MRKQQEYHKSSSSDRFVEKSRLRNHAVQTLDVGIIFS